MDKLNNYKPSQNNIQREETLLNVSNESTDDTAAPVSPLSHDDGLVAESHTSSPLSSLSQPLSPHDSGLEENHSDFEINSSRNHSHRLNDQSMHENVEIVENHDETITNGELTGMTASVLTKDVQESI